MALRCLTGLALLLLAVSCHKKPSRDAVVLEPAGVLTSFSAVQSWTAALLSGVDKPGLVDPAFLSPRHEATPSQKARFARARYLVAWGGPVDEAVVKAFGASAPNATVLTAGPAGAEDRYNWLNPQAAAEAIRRLATQLREAYPDQAGRITQNEEALLGDLEALETHIGDLMTGLPSRRVLLDTSRLAPFVAANGLEMGGTLTNHPGRPLTDDEADRFQELMQRQENGVMLVASQQDPAVLRRGGAVPNVALVYIDPILEGYVGPQHYRSRMERNALVLSSALHSRVPGIKESAPAESAEEY